MATPNDNTLIAAQILIEVKDALNSVKVLDSAIGTSALKISNWAKIIKAESEKTGRSIAEITEEFVKLNNATKAGALGKFNIPNKVIQDAGKLAESIGDTGNKADDAGNKMQNAGNKGKGAFERVLSATNILNITFGILASTLIRNVLGAFQQMFQTAIKGLKEMESAIFNIENAERKLSKMGIEISVKGLKETIEGIQELDPTLSKFQATELVSVLSSKVAPALKLGEDNISSLAKSITILALRNRSLGKSFEEVESQAITALLSGRVTQGINQLGVKINDQIVLEEAINTKLVANEDAYKALNAQQQERINVLAIQSILEKNVAEEIESLPRYMQTVTGLSGQLNAEWTDVLTSLGEKFSPLIKEILALLIDILQKTNDWIEENEEGITLFINSLADLLGAYNDWKDAQDSISETFDNLAEKGKAIGYIKEFLLGIKDALTEIIQRMFIFIPGLGQLVYSFGQLKRSVEGLTNIKKGLDEIVNIIDKKFPGAKQKWDELFHPQSPETPTSPVVPDASGALDEEAKEAEKAAEKLQDIMQDNADKLADIERDYKRKIQDINRDYNEKLADIARNSARAREDATRNYAEKVEDIERDAAEKIAEAQEDYRKKEIDREAEYQRKLRDLREKFLFDLEDALRERDARQVLRLMRQYNLDKRNLEERRQLERQEAAQNLAEKLQDIEFEKQKKLEAAKREYEEKLAEIKRGEARERAEASRWKQRQLEDARIWYQRQLADQREFLRRKLADLQQAYAQQLAMQQQMQNALNQTSGVLGYNTSSGGNSGVLGYNTSSSGNFSPFSQNSGFRPYGFAEGGTLIAKRPTVAMFGESGAEMVNFTPLNKSGTNIGKVFGDIGGLGGAGGQISLRVMLSEGLIAEIVDASMNNVASHIEYTRRSA